MMKAFPVCSILHTICLLFLVSGCSRDRAPISEERHVEPEKLYEILLANVRANPEFEVITDINHSRLASEAGSSMLPSHVLIWQDADGTVHVTFNDLLAPAGRSALTLPL